ncbi:DNA-binding response regulator, NarL/FixJ family, contains REC and HTH domains [Pseudarcicella hirudinis]|uniref:DNA-binding response regulator, NarL/FixJ family, contains REC and HTH domains n=1 Tax=Pseudarcicella hirudinis TaxID=1079859 RepID=A0A1I5P3K8_9BACT|nr:response regulator transcription factor [Pseudarcicella hirudinis]SFP28557.1 DNA-binding response regulator, NarL/FixJ family, contains REC and HTH domains [Pseudarcicella hirudinis]
MKHSIVIADDHQLVAKAISGLIQKLDDFEVMYEVANGKELIRHFKMKMIPDIVLLDINMPEMDGYETALWLKNNYPEVKVLALSMYDKEEAIVGMLRNGARGYLLKGCKPAELKEALDSIVKKGFYYTEHVTDKLIKSLNPEKFIDPVEALGLNEREKEFIRWACTDLTYAEIAEKMCVSPRTIDGYREQVFQKLNVKSRVGVAIEAIKLGIVVL